ncbi:valyl-tRNA synthetase [Thermodesulfovibrio aggregans]|uniref:Valine--tRNA ligase n=1 Tax=Thermodesulfovibrio aggregans TaxID=86166 RepID=A0A0U9HPH0_9BACT|nr:valyl-tRNA synthetase [Thermodesulfovibrio aggregans]
MLKGNVISDTYQPKEVETKLYKFWEEKGYFKPDSNPKKLPYCIVIPPPNVTGSLHMGHALNATLQDILIRWKRMLGYAALWIPGTDHAGIATQNVVERELLKEGLSRYQLGRTVFLQRVWQWKESCGGRIIEQLKRIGASCDWSRLRFTMDEGLSQAVKEVFLRLFEEGLIYRDLRLINWCPRCHTALSDLEVEHEELEGKLYYIKYPFKDDPQQFITVATTRPETMLGDTAVAVNPEDKRYRNFIGKTLILPLMNREIPIIADSVVDMEFGTGAVKVTPCHDFNDAEIAQRHNIGYVCVIDEEGRMTEEAGKYKGLDRYDARKQVIADLEKLGLIEKVEKHKHSVGHCYRCKTVIEPLQTVQWYVKIKPLAEEAVRVVQEGKIRFVPEGWVNNYYAWMRDIKDWCISRQLWWGHRIPVWYCAKCKTEKGIEQGDLIEILFYKPFILNGREIWGGTYNELRKLGITKEDIEQRAKVIKIPKEITHFASRTEPEVCPHCGNREIIQDPDVLDTWFSSALWPFSTLGWPEETEDLKRFYPTNVLVTGFDIIFFWVARMIMMGMKFMKDVPFRDVYIHALVRDSKGQKMSKSKGNVIDPLVMIEKYGADAFRFTLAAFAAQGRDIKFSEERVEGYRHFINKIWNAMKFIMSFAHLRTKEKVILNELKAIKNRWILSKLAEAVEETNKALEAYRFNDAANSVYQFLWHEFCDWYIELSKVVLYAETEDKEETVNCLFYVFENVLKLLHPFMPYVTEEIWLNVLKKESSIMIFSYPTEDSMERDEESIENMEYIMQAISGVRSIRGELNISPSVGLEVFIKPLTEKAQQILIEGYQFIQKLARAKTLKISKDIVRQKGSAISVKKEFEIYIPVKEMIDIGQEKKRLIKELQKTEADIKFLNKKLMNEDFIKNAPKEVVEKDKEKYEELLLKSDKIKENLKVLEELQD